MLLILWATGILVIVRCFSHRESFDKEIAAHLGSSFSRMPYIILVGSLTLLALVATLPLVQLFFFHMILIHKVQ
jgi:flagellar biosynthesis component FlhA